MQVMVPCLPGATEAGPLRAVLAIRAVRSPMRMLFAVPVMDDPRTVVDVSQSSSIPVEGLEPPDAMTVRLVSVSEPPQLRTPVGEPPAAVTVTSLTTSDTGSMPVVLLMPMFREAAAPLAVTDPPLIVNGDRSFHTP